MRIMYLCADRGIPVRGYKGAAVHVRDREFKGQPLIWAAEGSRQGREGRDFAAVGNLLLDAGSPVEWATGDEPAEGILEIVAAWRLGRAART